MCILIGREVAWGYIATKPAWAPVRWLKNGASGRRFQPSSGRLKNSALPIGCASEWLTLRRFHTGGGEPFRMQLRFALTMRPPNYAVPRNAGEKMVSRKLVPYGRGRKKF